MTKAELTIRSITSARWLLTVAVGVSFLILVCAYVRGDQSLSPDALATIMTSVFSFYFLAKDRNGKEEGNGSNTAGK